VSELDQKWNEAERAAKDIERLWRENIAYLEGIQYTVSNADKILNVMGVNAGSRSRLVDNQLLDLGRRLLARLDQPKFEPNAYAITDDPADQKASKLCHASLRWFYNRKKVAAEKRTALWWLIPCGNVYLEPYYDPDAGKQVPTPQKGEDGELKTQPMVENG